MLSPFARLSVIAAAAKNDYYRKNDNPRAVVVIEDVTQAVVVHYVRLRELLCGVSHLILCYAEGEFL